MPPLFYTGTTSPSSQNPQRRKSTAISTTWAVATILLALQGCSSTSGAIFGAGIWSFGWPAWAIIWAGAGERIGASAERSSEDEAQIRTIFDAIPARELQNQISSWNTAGVIYMNSKWKVHVIPRSRNGDMITLEVRGIGSDNKSSSGVQIRLDARWVPIK